MKEKKTQNNSLNASSSKKEVKKQDKSSDDLMIEQSLELVKNLNAEIAKIHVVKDSIKKEVQNLTKRVETQEKNSPKNTSSHPKIKDEILKEINPLLEKLSFKSIKGDLYKEIGELLDLEIGKLKSEFDNKNKKTHKDVVKNLSDIELRIVDVVKSNSNLKDEFKKFENKKVAEMFSQFETNLHEVIATLNKKVLSFIKSNESEIDNLKKLVSNQSNSFENISKSVSSFQKQLKEVNREDSFDLSSIESKILKIEKENKSIKSLLEKYENELYNREKNESLEIEERVKKLLESSEENFKLLKIAKSDIEKELLLKTREYFDKEGAKILNSYLSKIEKSSFKNLFDEFKVKFSEFKMQAEFELKNSVDDFEKDKEGIKINLEKVKNEFLENLDNYMSKIDDELKNLKDESKKFNKRVVEISSDFDLIKEDNKILVNDLKEKVIQDLDLKVEEFIKKSKQEILDQIDFNKKFLKELSFENQEEREKFFKDIDKIKNDFLIQIKKYITHLDSELKVLKKEQTNLENNKKLHIENVDLKIKEFGSRFENILLDINDARNKEKEYLVSKYNEIVEEFDSMKNKNNKIINESKESFNKELEYKFSNFIKESKEEISKQILSNNEFLTRKSTELKEAQKNIFETVENKIDILKSQYEEEFRSHLKDFDEKLSERENYFDEKLSVIDKENTESKEELASFKLDIAKTTKNYVETLNEELLKVRAEELQVEEKKKELIYKIDEYTKAKQTQLEGYFEKLEFSLKKIIDDEKETFEKNENTFREVFGEKISNLNTIFKNKLEIIEKKTIEMNAKIIENRFKEELETIKLIEDELNAKEDTLNKKIESIENKESVFEENILNQTEKLKSKVEERLIGLEKQLNKRFLELDVNFSNFKGIVVDEVEDLIKDVNSIVGQKIESIDKSLAKTNFLNNEISNKLVDINKISDSFNDKFKDLRDDLNDLRVKFEILSPEGHSLTDHIQYMKVYEEQLIGLIRNLRERGVDENSIMSALTNKGHPRFYVKMILEDYDKLFN